ncbi:hypothetical protein NDU88_003511 [Pleurodeles waltl]|uniref:Uncharacterized protein n=1 Tax=Pleurodeles waltl TaxID=8319 RepID=A0AAV7RGF5_PLEWA|nr:hypothetical protein NDU88_003511 [Pleurodeles waltl]
MKRLPRASQAEPSVLFERSALPPLSPEERISLQRVSSEELGQHRRVATRRVCAGRALLRKRVEARCAPQERAAGEPNVRKERSALPVKREASASEEKRQNDQNNEKLVKSLRYKS